MIGKAHDSERSISRGSIIEWWIAAVIADAAAGRSRDGRTARLVRHDAGTVSDHRVLPHPRCEVCNSSVDGSEEARLRANALLRSGPIHATNFRARTLDEVEAKVLPLMVDERCGMVRRVASLPTSTLLPVSAAHLCSSDPSNVDSGYGRGGTSSANRTVALMEALERFSATRPRGDLPIVQGSFADLSSEAIDPAAFVLPAADQLHEPGSLLEPYGSDRVYDWVWGHSVRRAEAVLVPTQMAFYGAPEGRRNFVLESSSGCSGGSSVVEAALHGLLEVIERDAFLNHWYGRLPVDVVDVDACGDSAVRAIAARLGADGRTLEAYHLNDGVAGCSIAVRVTDPSERIGPACMFAASTHLSPVNALRAALVEVATSLNRVAPPDLIARQARGRTLIRHPHLVQNMVDHVDQCWPLEAIDQFAFRLSGASPIELEHLEAGDGSSWRQDDIQAAFRHLATKALAVCEDVIIVDQTLEPFSSESIHCVKVLAPGLLPMTFGHQHRRISTRRWERQRTGTTSAVGNYVPHPFP